MSPFIKTIHSNANEKDKERILFFGMIIFPEEFV